MDLDEKMKALDKKDQIEFNRAERFAFDIITLEHKIAKLNDKKKEGYMDDEKQLCINTGSKFAAQVIRCNLSITELIKDKNDKDMTMKDRESLYRMSLERADSLKNLNDTNFKYVESLKALLKPIQ